MSATQKITGYSSGAAFVDGDYCPIDEARIPLKDLGFIRSDATYDVVHVWKGKFFRLSDHVQRFMRGWAPLRFDLPYSQRDVEAILNRIVALSGLQDAYVSMTASRGPLPPGSRNPLDCRNRLYAFAIPFSWISPFDEQPEGIDLVVATPPRIPPDSVDPTIKNYHWGDLTRGLFEAIDQGAKAAIHLDQSGNVTEGAGFNFFAVKDGVVWTPDAGVLLGITRRTVIEIAEKQGIPVRVASLSIDRVRGADELFVSSTAGGVIPVRRLDGAAVGQGRNWSTALKIRDEYWRMHEDPVYATPVDYSATA